MKDKLKIENILTVIVWLLLIGFCICLGCDYFLDYTKHPEYSAPFSAWVLLRSVEFILPAMICFFVSLILKRRHTK